MPHNLFKLIYFYDKIVHHVKIILITFCVVSVRCGKCRRYMKLIATKPCRLHCPICDETLSVPQGGNIRIYKELKCPLDDFELLQYTTGVKGKVRNVLFKI